MTVISSEPLSGELGAHETVKARIRQSRLDSGLDFQAKVLNTFQGVPSLLESGQPIDGGKRSDLI